MTEAYQTISEIYREDTGELIPPLEEWKIEVVEQDLSEDLGDVGGREPLVANARSGDGTGRLHVVWNGASRVEVAWVEER